MDRVVALLASSLLVSQAGALQLWAPIRPRVEVLPPLRSSPPPQRVPRLASARPQKLERSKELAAEEVVSLSDEAVANIFELVWRDTRMLFSTAQKRPLPVALSLAWERVPIALWFCRDRSDKLELELNRRLAACKLYRTIAPRAAADLGWQRERVERRLQENKETLWPTLRALLLKPTTHQRVVQAARTQLFEYRLAASRTRVSGRARLAAGSRRAVSLWIALWSWGLYALRWLLLALPRVEAVNLLLPAERRQVRACRRPRTDTAVMGRFPAASRPRLASSRRKRRRVLSTRAVWPASRGGVDFLSAAARAAHVLAAPRAVDAPERARTVPRCACASQRVRTELIERAVERGLELQRRVDTIDRSTFLVDARAAPTRRLLPPATTGGARRALLSSRWVSSMWRRVATLFADGRRSFTLRVGA